MRRATPILITLIAAALVGCAEEPPPVRPQPRFWYSGGTVHNADVVRWREVEDRNRLATCADLVTKELLNQGVAPNALDVEKLKPWATQLKACIDQAVDAGAPDDARVPELAAPCLEQMQISWPPKP